LFQRTRACTIRRCDAYQQPQLVRKQELWERSVKLLLFLFQGLELSLCLISKAGYEAGHLNLGKCSSAVLAPLTGTSGTGYRFRLQLLLLFLLLISLRLLSLLLRRPSLEPDQHLTYLSLPWFGKRLKRRRRVVCDLLLNLEQGSVLSAGRYSPSAV